MIASRKGMPARACSRNEIDQQDRVANDDAGERDHADHRGGGELRTEQRMAGHDPDQVSGIGAMITSGTR